LQGADIVKFIKILQNKKVWTRRKDAKPKYVKTNCSGYNRRNKKRGRPRKRWKDEVEEDFNIMEIKNGIAVAGDRGKWRKIVLQAEVHNGL
jgi:hypothetical protein